MGGRRTSERRRKQATRSPGRIIAFVSEGRVTEPEYFEGVRSRYGISTGSLRFVRSNKTNPIGLVEDAIDERRKNIRAARAGREARVDEWWVLFDAEGPLHPHAGIDKALTLARDEGIRVALSDPSFEFWLLLHYRYTTRQHQSADEVIADLSQHMPGYASNQKHLVKGALMDRVDNALQNASCLRSWREDSSTKSPATDVDLLVKSAIDLTRSEPTPGRPDPCDGGSGAA